MTITMMMISLSSSSLSLSHPEYHHDNADAEASTMYSSKGQRLETDSNVDNDDVQRLVNALVPLRCER